MSNPKKIRVTGHRSSDGCPREWVVTGKVYDVYFWDSKTGTIPRVIGEDGEGHWLVNTTWDPADDDIGSVIFLLENFIRVWGNRQIDEVTKAVEILKKLPRP